MSAILTRAPSRPIPPARLVEKLARGKCLAVAARHPGDLVLGCDTVVDVNGEVFGKPHSVEDAKRMLRALSGATHQVHTGRLRLGRRTDQELCGQLPRDVLPHLRGRN